MFAPRVRGALWLGVVVVVAACGGGGSEPTTTTPSALDIVSGNGQVGLIGFPLTVPLAVRVTGSGTPVKGASVLFAVTNGAASVSPTTAITDSLGQAKTVVTLGSSPGTVAISATVVGTNLTAAFVETAGASSQPLACATGSPTTPVAGAVVPGVSGTGVCLGGGTAGADYAVVAFYGNPDSSATINLSARGATGLSSASAGPGANAPNPLLTPHTSTLQATFDRQLRESAHRDLTSKIPFARAQFAQRQRASLTAIPANPAIGTLVTLNAQGNQGFSCTNPINVIARVAAVSNLAIVVADTANPAGGFTDAEFQGFATTFDTLISPLDVGAFGSASDIDGNGKTIIFFTKEVNRLTPKGSPDGVIGGFFHERDLFPVVTNQQSGLAGCPTSNFAEMYYSLVPDSIGPNQGRYGDIRTKSYVQSLTLSTLVHEFQHLINASRRLYVNNSDVFEDVWLNEGLSHIAEELLFYHAGGVAPRQNIAASNFTGNQQLVDAFNNYQGDNFERYELFIEKTPGQTSPYAENDLLETRGATWNLLRYLADHRGSSDGDVWSQLDNSITAGQANLRNVFGADYLTQIRDWATSVFADDVVGQADPRFSQPSWNMRSIFPALCTNAACTTHLGRFPLAVVPLSDAAPATVSLTAGGVAYFRFSVPANTSASIDWSNAGLPVTALMQFSVVRTR